MHCFGQRINGIVVRSSAPTASFLRRAPVLRDVVSAIHVTTNPEVIQRFLLLSRGDACDELRRADSERILRAQPFIAEASVRAIPDSDGGVTLLVETSDEISSGARRRDRRRAVRSFGSFVSGTRTSTERGCTSREIGETAARFATRSAGASSTIRCSAGRTRSARRPTEIRWERRGRPTASTRSTPTSSASRGWCRSDRSTTSCSSRTTSTRPMRFVSCGASSSSAACCASVRRGG